MANPWDGDQAVDEGGAARRIAARFPQLAGAPVEYLDEGWDSRAFVVDGKWVFRLTKHSDNKDAAVEIPLLRLLEGRLPLPIPRVEFDGETFFGYAMLPGRSLSGREPEAGLKDVLAPQLGRFLTALHGIDPAPVPVPPGVRRVEKLRDRALSWLDSLKGLAGFASKAKSRLEAGPETYEGEMRLCHADLGPEHILLEGDRVSGIIDWADARVADPSADFAGFALWAGEAFLQQVLAYYDRPIDAGLARRAVYRAICFGVLDAHYGVEAGKPEYLRDGERALRLLL